MGDNEYWWGGRLHSYKVVIGCNQAEPRTSETVGLGILCKNHKVTDKESGVQKGPEAGSSHPTGQGQADMQSTRCLGWDHPSPFHVKSTLSQTLLAPPLFPHLLETWIYWFRSHHHSFLVSIYFILKQLAVSHPSHKPLVPRPRNSPGSAFHKLLVVHVASLNANQKLNC